MVGATLVGIPGCSDDFDDNDDDDANVVPQPEGTYSFPQGVASGDPRATSVVLWTRVAVVGSSDSFGAVSLRVQVSANADFGTLVVDQALIAGAGTDHTVRVLVTGLAAATTYYYRFVASKDTISGRTRTAPDAAADVQVNLAWVSCQDYGAGHYGAYRQLIVDDDARPDADKIHAIVHLGDMIYETRTNDFQTAIDDDFKAIALTNRDGTPRAVAAFPSGGGTRAGTSFAATLADYRHLYRTFLSDPDLQAARARWPFIAVWDDHEFTNDCWQSQANYDSSSSLNEGDQTRRVAASQAWFEYVPAHLTGAGSVPDVPNQARDFSRTIVKDAPFEAPNADNFVAEPNNAAAVGAITIYRSLRFGKHVELVMTDERSYRSDHAVPEELAVAPVFFDPRNALPLPLVNTFDQGKTANNNNPPDTVSFLGGAVVFPNVRKASPPGTMLGKRQKEWWKATMKGSDATWKLWGNEVTLMRLRILQAGSPQLVADRVITGDAWDGYPTERNELMTYLRTEEIKNVVVLSGDIHASFAGVVMDNFDASTPKPVACELVACGVSSNSLFSFFEFATRPPLPPELRALITVNASAVGGSAFVENLNLLLLKGTLSAGTFEGAIRGGFTPAQALGAALDPGVADENTNAHLKYADTNTQGYGYVKITGAKVDASIVTINRPLTPPTAAGPGIKRIANFTIPKTDPDSTTVPTMIGPTITGTKPFPLT